jgi:vitamin B12/bleomycin/antimicrobial peptide transport system ATP-binding/permease protein
MRLLSVFVVVFALVCTFASFSIPGVSPKLLAAVCFACAAALWQAQAISSFLKVFLAIFAVETVVFGTAWLAAGEGFWPRAWSDYTIPDSLCLSVALFAVLIWAVSHLPVIRAMTRIADSYFETADRTRARLLVPFETMERRLAAAMIVFLVVVNQAEVAVTVRLSFFNRDWFNAIQSKDGPEFWRQLMLVFVPWAFVYVAMAVTEFVVRSVLVVRWRRWLTGRYVAKWLDGPIHYRMALGGLNADNPDQRIAEDVNRFIDGGDSGYGIYSYSVMLISTLTSLVSFSVILWALSADFTLPGTNIALPGFLFWVALIYAAIGTAVTHLIGRSLVGLFFTRQKFEANFRFGLARLREYGEQIALLRGENTERRQVMSRFQDVFSNYLAIVSLRKRLIAFTAFYGQISPIIPYVLTAPFYFLGKVTLGIMTQTASAFGNVNDSLNFFVTYYTTLADYRSVLERLRTFDEALERAHALGNATDRIHVESSGSPTSIGLSNVSVDLPDGRRILNVESMTLEPQTSALVSGPSGVGKSTFFRALSGIWPYGRGRVLAPDQSRLLVMPQKPYFPVGTLRAAIAYPQSENAYPDEEVRSALEAAMLPDFVGRLEESDNWTQRLSGGEQQRVAIARALLVKPDWLFLDEATSALDEGCEADLYAMLRRRLPETTVVSIGHRSTLSAFHERTISFKPHAAKETTPGPDAAAEAAR